MLIRDWSSDVCSSDLYQECLAIEFETQGIPFIPKPKQQIAYRGRILTQTYESDFVCLGSIIVELRRSRTSAERSSVERRVGKEFVSTCRSRWSPYTS